MVEKLIQQIMSETFPAVKQKLNNVPECDKMFKDYLSRKYSAVLSELLAEESEETVRAIVHSYITDEENLFSDLNAGQVLSIINFDPSYEQLSFLSNFAFEQAKNVAKTGIFLSESEKYQNQLDDLALCLSSIQSYNVKAAKELLSEAILDIEYAFGKSQVKSLRLSRI